MKVIITGAAGFIGYALTKKFSDMQAKVYAVVREGSQKLQDLRDLNGVEIIECDLKHYTQLEELITERDFDAFFHLAWQGSGGKDKSKGAQNLEVQLDNVKYSCDAVHIAKKLRCRKFIFAASLMEYEVMKLMETELDSNKRNIYMTAKLTAHYMTRIAANDVGIDYNAAIISNVFGAGEISDRFIYSTLRNMLSGVRAKFSEAKQLYDFIYIDDAVDMLALVAEKGLKNKNYYIGSMEPRRLRDYIYDIRDCIDPSIELGIGEYKEYLGAFLTYDELDIKACYKDFGFTPSCSFKDGIIKTIEWLKVYGALEERKDN